MKNKIILSLLTVTLNSAVSFGYGGTTRLVETRELRCGVTTESGYSANIKLSRELFERSKKQVPLSRREVLHFTDADNNLLLSRIIVSQYNAFQKQVSHSSRGEAVLFDGAGINVSQTLTPLPVETKISEFQVGKLVIEKDSLALNYQNEGYSYAVYVDLRTEVNLTQAYPGFLNLSATLTYSFIGLDDSSKTSTNKMVLSGLCEL